MEEFRQLVASFKTFLPRAGDVDQTAGAGSELSGTPGKEGRKVLAACGSLIQEPCREPEQPHRLSVWSVLPAPHPPPPALGHSSP